MKNLVMINRTVVEEIEDMVSDLLGYFDEYTYSDALFIVEFALGMKKNYTPEEYMLEMYNEYVERRKYLIDGLNRIPGVYSPIPMGAFYTVARLPIDDSDKFCAWLLSDFEYEGQTVMMAPASGFYTGDGIGKNEVRLAYVLEKEELSKALFVLKKALEVYPGRTI